MSPTEQPGRQLEAARRRRRVFVLLLCGISMPGLLGVGAAGVAVLFDLGWRGMDAYVPFFLGGAAGCALGAGFALAAGIVHLQAVRSRRGREGRVD